jgi:CopA family copper-resistance protein
MSRSDRAAGTAISRRRFTQGVAAGGVFAAAWPLRSVLAAPGAPVLSGTDFRLEIGPMPMNVTGRPMTGIGINGLVPAPILRWREGDTVTIAVTNRLAEPTSIHWHGILLPNPMDGVPGLTFRGIEPGETFVYRFPVRQSGTYWYHSHSGSQEQLGLYGAIVIQPKAGYPQAFDRDYVVFLSDWSDEIPDTIVSNLKFQPDYYNYNQRTVGTFLADVGRDGLKATLADWAMWGEMRMSPTDILDVTGATYTYLINGQPPAANWTALFRPGERVRLRFVNGSAMTIFDVRIPDLPMTVVQADGIDVQPVTVEQFRISVAETYDVIVQPRDDRAFTIFVQPQDRTGFARGTLAPRPGMTAPVPPLDPRPVRTMADMGMADMDHGTGHESMPGMQTNQRPMAGMDHGGPGGMSSTGRAATSGTDHAAMGHGAAPGMAGMAAGTSGEQVPRGVGVDNVAMSPTERLNHPGEGFPPGRRVLTYADLRALKLGADPRPPSREITLHLTGNMERFMWGFDGKKFSEAGPIELARNERVRFVLINDTMMDHPIHLHGMFSELENGHGEYRPLKHTISVKGGERLSFLVTAELPGRWAFHCHLLFHMEMGMFREVRVA